jgi:hypothetical protein
MASSNTNKVDLEQFMIDLQKETGFTFNTFHAMFRYVNDRYFGKTLYQQIKNNEITVQEVATRMKAAL